MRLPSLLQFRILKEVFKALFTGPYTTKFPYEPHVPADKFRGKPEYDDEECVGCGACSEVCPAQCIDMVDEEKRKFTLHYDDCIFCGQCQANCITEKGITLTKEFDLALFDRSLAIEEVEKELLRCEFCNSVIGALDHIKWLAQKLGPSAYSNPTIMLASLKELTPLPPEADRAKEVPRPEKPLTRADHIRILCPHCRRKVTLTEK